MVAVVKSEWHSIERRYGFELTRDFLDEVYPELEPDELDLKYQLIEAGELCVDEVISDAYNESIDIDWDWLDEDDMWTDRKGGYDVTYEVDSTREFSSSYYVPPMAVSVELDLPVDEGVQPKLSADMEPQLSVEDLRLRLQALQDEFDFQDELLIFKDNEEIHPEIRAAFIQILKDEDMLYD
jgi:hypothetical protein